VGLGIGHGLRRSDMAALWLFHSQSIDVRIVQWRWRPQQCGWPPYVVQSIYSLLSVVGLETWSAFMEESHHVDSSSDYQLPEWFPMLSHCVLPIVYLHWRPRDREPAKTNMSMSILNWRIW
jgi:hypothetical protein